MSKYTRPNYNAQSLATWKSNSDNADTTFERGVGIHFQPHGEDTPAMTVRLEAGDLLSGTALTTVAAQSTGTITAPSTNPRIDRVVIDDSTGAVSVVTGTESTTPVAPDITAGTFPVAQVALTTTSTAIIDSMITDERTSFVISTAGGGGGDAWGDAVDADIVPDADGQRDLGSTGTRFAETYTDALDVTNNITVGGTVDGRDIAADGTKLDAIEASADVTAEANVKTALDGATLTAVTVATGDKVLVQDASDSDNLKTVTAQSIADLAAGGGGGGHWEYVSTTTISDDATVELTGLTATAYRLVFTKIIPQTDGQSLNLRMSNDNGSTWATADYQYSWIEQEPGTFRDGGSTSAPAILVHSTSGIGNAATEYGLNGEMSLLNMSDAAAPASTCARGSFMDGDGDFRMYSSAGISSDDPGSAGVTLDVDAIQLFFGSGNIASGTIYLYKLVTS